MSKPAFVAIIVAAFAFASSLATARAGETPWRDIALGAKMRVITSDKVDQGRMLIGVELALLPDQKTYWYVPGETGIPIEIGLTSGGKVFEATPFWPMPKRVRTGRFIDNVYEGEVTIPLSVVVPPAGHPAVLQIRLGVCSEICVPVNTEIILPALSARADTKMADRLAKAMRLVPQNWPHTQKSPVLLTRIDAETGAVWLTYDAGHVSPAELFVTRDGANTTYGEPTAVNGSPGMLRVDRLGRPGKAHQADGALRLTFAYRGQPFTLAVPSP